MKHLFCIFISLCVLSFIAFGISVAVLGTGWESAAEADTTGYPIDVEAISGDYAASGNSSWVLSESYSDICLDIGSCNVILYASDNDETLFEYNCQEDDTAIVHTEIIGDTLNVSIEERSGIDFVWRFFNRLVNSIISGSRFNDLFSSGTLKIYVPEKVYDSLEVYMGAGSVTVNEINALDNDFEIGSGSFYYNGSDSFTAYSAEIYLGSGRIETTNLATTEYDIEIGSGSFNIDGLTGRGEFYMGSGSGALGFAELNGSCEIDVGSGSLKVALPSDASARIEADMGSGSVKLATSDYQTSLQDGQGITLNGGKYDIEISLGSGSVKITDYSAVEIAEADVAIVTDFGERTAATTATHGDAITEATEVKYIDAVAWEIA